MTAQTSAGTPGVRPAGIRRAAAAAGARRAVVALLAAAVVLGLGITVGAAMADGESAATGTSAGPGVVDIGFSQDMIVHHEQAVVMAQLVRSRTTDPKVAALAAGIEDDQLLDIGALRGYLALWAAPILPSGPPMTWMAAGDAPHDMGSSTMPGMATVAELNELRAAKGAALDRTFLELMFRHHAGGQTMLVDAGEHASIPAVRALANQMAFHQREETQTIVALLTARGIKP